MTTSDPDAGQRGPRLDPDPNELRQRAARGGAWTIGGQLLRSAFQLLGLAILSRLLRPSDFGLIAMATVVLGALELFKDGGLSLVTIQQKDLDLAQLTKLFWLNVALGVVLFFAAAAAAPAVAGLYREPRLQLVTIVLGGTFLFGGLGVQHLALLQRQMRLGAHAATDLLARPLALGAAIYGALIGLHYWALVTQQLALVIGQVFLAWALARWLPRLRWGRTSVSTFVKSGSHVLLGNIAMYVSRTIDDVLIGRFLGARELGLYANAYRFFMLPLKLVAAPLNTVAVPTLSRLQDDPRRFREYVLTAVAALAFVTAPIAAALVVMSEEIIALTLGAGWERSAHVMRYLAISAFAQPYGAAVGWLFVSFGRMRSRALAAWIGALWLSASIVVGLPYGIEGVALCFALASLIWSLPGLLWACHGTSVSFGAISGELIRPLASAALAGLAAHLLLPHAGEEPLLRLLLGSVAGSIVYLVMQLGIFRQGHRLSPILDALRAGSDRGSRS